MATSFSNKINDLQARLRAENEAKGRDKMPRNLSLGSPQPPRSFRTNPGHVTTSSGNGQPGYHSSTSYNQPVQPPTAIQQPIQPFFSTNNTHRHSPAPCDLSSRLPPTTPRPRNNSIPMDTGSMNFCLEKPPTRGRPPNMDLSAISSISASASPSPPPSSSAVNRPSLGLDMGGFGPASPGRPSGFGPPRKRGTFQLPCSPQAQRQPDSSEIEKKYQEIMKQSGILTLDNQKIYTEMNDLEHVCDLGHGTCGHVVKMKHKRTGHFMAVKQMRRSGNKEENKRIIMDLDVVIKSHDCPFIVQCLGTYIMQSEVWICMELMATCLEKLLKRLQAPVPEHILGKVAVATVKALNYLKEKHGVIHRDVKPSNILLDEKGTIKLCDFGISGRLVDSKAKTRSAGCAAYMAPERIDPPDPTQPDYDIRADVWSLGISLVELATGQFPYRDCKTDFEVLSRVLQEDPPILPVGSGFSRDFCSFVSKCLTKDYKRRPKYRQLLETLFIKRYERVNVDVSSWYHDITAMIENQNFTWQ